MHSSAYRYKYQTHRFEGKELKSVEQERDLGIIIHQNGEASAQWKNQQVIVGLYKASDLVLCMES